MKSKLTIFLIISLLLVPSILAVGESYNPIVVPYGENATASLPLFSRTHLMVHEGTKLDFNVVDPDNGVVLIRNTVIIKEIGQESTKVALSLDGGPYNDTEFVYGEEMQLNYSYSFMPFMSLNYNQFRYVGDEEDRNIVLYFNIPFLKTGKTFDDIEGGAPSGFASLNTNQVSPGNTEKKGWAPIVFVLIGVIILLILALVYLNLKFFKKSKHR